MPTLAQRQRKELEEIDDANLEAIARAYSIMWDRLQGDTDALMFAIEELDDPSQSEIKQLPEYKRLMRRTEEELDRFNTYLAIAIGAAALAAITLGMQHSQALVAASGVNFAGLDASVMKPLLDYLREDGPLYQRLALITDGTIDRVIASIMDGVASGFNPQKIARGIQDAFGGGLTDALRNMRTVQLYSYRDAARANYMASGVVEKWQWWAELDGLTCMSCIAEHGTLHDLNEQLAGHYNCRCAAVPYIEGLSEPVQSGADWFNSLSDEQQAAQMGKEYHAAYKDGAFTLNDMIKPVENEIYGKMNQVTPLWELLGAEPP